MLLESSSGHTKFRVGDLTSAWSKIDALASPSRRRCDLFWLALPWKALAAELGSAVNALEVGCGSRITRLFGAETSKRLYSLGSAACNRLHRRYITYPWLLGKGDRCREHSAAYDRELREAIWQDDIGPKRHEASFHALVLQSRLTRDIFRESH
jgi:hypothetical protein